MDPSLTGLRVLRAVADHGSFTAAAAQLGYTQSAVSRQVATLENEAGGQLFERRPTGVRLTSRGLIVLRHARTILDEIDAAQRELDGDESDVHDVRLGTVLSGGAVLVPRVVRALRSERPDIRVTTREGTTPALVRALRAGTLDVAVIGARPPYRPPDDEQPALSTTIIDEATLMLAASATGRFAGRSVVSVAELDGIDWIASPSSSAESLMGVWPGLTGRPRVAHTARDWLTKLAFVAADCGITTVPPHLASVLPEGVQLMRVDGTRPELRRALIARLPGRVAEPVAAVIEAIRVGFPR
jgi:DNA-binding transcriptional LysR family regulator